MRYRVILPVQIKEIVDFEEELAEAAS